MPDETLTWTPTVAVPLTPEDVTPRPVPVQPGAGTPPYGYPQPPAATAVDWHSALEVTPTTTTGVLVRPVGGSFRETIGYPAATHFVVHPDGGVTLYAGDLVAAAWARGEWSAVEHWAPTP